MTTRVAVTLTILAATLAAPVAADAGSWATGHYRGNAKTMRSKASRGTLQFTVTRKKARLDHLTMKLVCMEGDYRTFKIDHAGSGKLNPGPVGAGVAIQGRRKIGDWDVDWDIVGGIKGSTFRGNVSGSASIRTETMSDNCTLIGDFTARRR
jgi:hypothetical protein